MNSAELRDQGEMGGPVDRLDGGDTLETEEDAAFEKASAARGAQTIESLRSVFGRRRPKEQLILLPAEAEAATAAVKLRARYLDVRLKRLMAWVVIIAVSLQLIVADFFLIHYVVLSERTPSDAVLIAWLSASVVEVIGIVAIVARNLFPNRGKLRGRGRRRKRAS